MIQPTPLAPPSRRAPSWAIHARRRPRSLEVDATPLIPLRPLTVGEAMDAAFLLVRRNTRGMLALPVLIAFAAAAYAVLSTLVVTLLGNATAPSVGILIGFLSVSIGATLLTLIMAWLQFVMCRDALRIVFGERTFGQEKLRWRDQLRLFGPALTYAVYLGAISTVISFVVTMLGYLVTLALGLILHGVGNGVGLVVALLLGELVYLAVLTWCYSWCSLVAPIYVAESTLAPEWIGVPARRTGILGAITRNFTLLGFKDSFRVMLGNLGGLLGVATLSAVVYVGTLLAVLAYVEQLFLPIGTASVLTVWVLILLVVLAVVMIAFSAYFAALQLVFYLDLRMRREGLDLALRFSMVPVPEPNQPGVA